MYHGHTDEPGDTNAGLIGPIIVARAGSAREDGSPKDVDREFITMFTVFDENVSPPLDANIEAFATDPKSVKKHDQLLAGESILDDELDFGSRKIGGCKECHRRTGGLGEMEEGPFES